MGRLTRELLGARDLEVAFADPYLSEEDAARLGATKMELDALCAWCDVLSLHAPDTPATKGMIGARQLALLRDGTPIVNTARGALIDPGALEAELVSGRLQAILDVTEPEPLPEDSPLRRLPNVILTPTSPAPSVRRPCDSPTWPSRRSAASPPGSHPCTRWWRPIWSASREARRGVRRRAVLGDLP